MNPQSIQRLNTSLNRATVAPPPVLKEKQLCLIGAPDAYRATYADVCAVEVPEATHRQNGNVSYQPVAYASFIDGARDAMANVLNRDPSFETYALNKSGSQLFGMIGFESDIPGLALTMALRSSYDKSIANQAGVGHAPFICANGCFSAEHMISAKHTTNVFDTLGKMLDELTNDSIAPVLERVTMIEGWRDIPMTNDLFFAYLGVLTGRRLLKINEMSAGLKYWQACHDGQLHDDHGGNNLFSAYQAVTATGQRTSPINRFRHYAGIDKATEAIALCGGSAQDAHIPEFNLEIREYVEAGEAK
jgi:hypothetical protein